MLITFGRPAEPRQARFAKPATSSALSGRAVIVAPPTVVRLLAEATTVHVSAVLLTTVVVPVAVGAMVAARPLRAPVRVPEWLVDSRRAKRGPLERRPSECGSLDSY